jgi:hypothetical protein
MPEQKGPRIAGAFAVTAATGAVACAACCVLPFALPVAVLAGFGSVLALVGRASFWMTTLAVVAVILAWVWIGWQSFISKARPLLSTLFIMAGATALTGIAVLWPQIEPVLIRNLL